MSAPSHMVISAAARRARPVAMAPQCSRHALVASSAALHTHRTATPAPTALVPSLVSSQQALVRTACGSGHARGFSSGLFRTTRTNLFLPPQVARVLGAAALVLAQTFYVAYRRESRKLDEEEAENERDTGKAGSRADKPFMTAVEAIQLLGIERTNPTVLQQARNISDGSQNVADLLPLKSAKDREAAKQTFDSLFATAMKHDNLFIAGKLSNAYRICVDPQWDQGEENSTDDSAGDAKTERIDSDSQQSHPEK